MSNPTSDSQSGGAGYPIDAENAAEMARLSKQGLLITELLGLLPWQPDPVAHMRILDVGCGPGEWALAFAQQFPRYEVVGIDISTIMIAYAVSCAQAQSVANVRYVVMDASGQPLQFPPASFDVVHVRFAATWQDTASWPVLFAECARVIRPKGIICSTETESIGVITTPAFAHYNALTMQAFRQAGKCFAPEGAQFGITAVQEKLLAHAGFERIQRSGAVLNYSSGTPAHPIWYDNYRTAFKLLQPFLLTSGLTTNEEIDLLYEQALEEMRAEDFCAVNFFQTVYGERATAMT